MKLNNPADFYSASIGILLETDRQTLLSLLDSAGTPMPETASDKDILDASFKALRDSLVFRSGLESYIQSSLANENFENYVDEQFFNVGGFDMLGATLGKTFTSTQPTTTTTTRTTTPIVTPRPVAPVTTTTQRKEGGTAFGNALRSIFSPENINTAVGAGINIAATRLQQNAAREGEQRAISFEVARAQAAAAEAEAARARDTTKKRNAWVVPVAVIGGLLIVGTVVFFAVRKKA
ncbi:MAG: hypothetical protein LLF94_10880 [Chlamydiales bacterium]|nr:hypothetical protein [Chlamydiales bacterium]